MKPVTFTDPNDSKTRGRRFAEEAEIHFEKEKDRPSIPLLQGQLAMFVYEGNLASGSKSVDYFMRAMKTHTALNNPHFLNPQGQGKSEARLQREREGLSWVMWGMYCTEWQVFSYMLKSDAYTSKARLTGFWLSKSHSKTTYT
jgi:hypothetical protein